MVASEAEVPTFQLVDKIGTKSQRHFLCFGDSSYPMVLVVMLIDKTGGWKFKMAAFKLQIWGVPGPPPNIYA